MNYPATQLLLTFLMIQLNSTTRYMKRLVREKKKKTEMK